MQCHVIILDTTGTTHAFYEIEKRKETNKEKQENKEDKSKEKYPWYLRQWYSEVQKFFLKYIALKKQPEKFSYRRCAVGKKEKNV